MDLRNLNKHLKVSKFHMLSRSDILPRIDKDLWFCVLDFQDTYFHISVHQDCKKYLRFRCGEQASQYAVLLSGLALAPLYCVCVCQL